MSCLNFPINGTMPPPILKIKEHCKGETEQMKEKIKIFCDYYLRSLNIAYSVERAGFCCEDSCMFGRQLLEQSDVREYLHEQMEELGNEMIDSCMDVLVAIAECMKSDREFDLMLGCYKDIYKLYGLLTGEKIAG